MIHRPGYSFPHYAAQRAADKFEIHTADDHAMLPDLTDGDTDGIGDIGLGPGLFQTFAIGFQIGEMEEILGTYILEEDIVLVVVKEDLEIFRAADPVMMIAFRADEQ